MSRVQPGRNARGVQLRVVLGVLGQTLRGLRIRGRLQDCAQVGRSRSNLDRRHLLVVATCCAIELERKLVTADMRDGIRQSIDRVIRDWQGAVASLVGHRELIVRVGLFADVDFEVLRFSVGLHYRGTVIVDDVLRIDQGAAIADQPVHSVVRAAFLICRQS